MIAVIQPILQTTNNSLFWSSCEKASHACRLDYPGIGPEHSHLKDWGRAEYYAATDKEALDAFQLVSRLEGIIPALETSHAFAYLEASSSPLSFDQTC